MARVKPNHPRRARAEYKPNYASMLTVEVKGEAVTLNRPAKRANGARGEALQGLATLIAGFPQKTPWKRVSGGRTR